MPKFIVRFRGSKEKNTLVSREDCEAIGVDYVTYVFPEVRREIVAPTREEAEVAIRTICAEVHGLEIFEAGLEPVTIWIHEDATATLGELVDQVLRLHPDQPHILSRELFETVLKFVPAPPLPRSPLPGIMVEVPEPPDGLVVELPVYPKVEPVLRIPTAYGASSPAVSFPNGDPFKEEGTNDPSR